MSFVEFNVLYGLSLVCSILPASIFLIRRQEASAQLSQEQRDLLAKEQAKPIRFLLIGCVLVGAVAGVFVSIENSPYNITPHEPVHKLVPITFGAFLLMLFCGGALFKTYQQRFLAANDFPKVYRVSLEKKQNANLFGVAFAMIIFLIGCVLVLY